MTGWGVYDMHGNMWEWCQDWYDMNCYNISPDVNPTGPSTGSSRIVRGGAFSYSAQGTRSADRSSASPGLRLRHIGARLLRQEPWPWSVGRADGGISVHTGEGATSVHP